MAFDTSGIAAFGVKVWQSLVYAIMIGGGLAIVVGSVWILIQRKRYEYLVRVWREDPIGSGNLMQTGTDKGGIIMDKKTSNRLFKLKKFRVGLTADNIPYFFGVKNQKVVNVLQIGLKEFRFLDKPFAAINSPMKMSHGVQDKDIAWGINEIERAKMYQKKTTLEALMPFLGMAFVFITVVVALYFIFIKAGFNADLLTRLAESSEKISQNLAVANSGTTVITGQSVGG